MSKTYRKKHHMHDLEYHKAKFITRVMRWQFGNLSQSYYHAKAVKYWEQYLREVTTDCGSFKWWRTPLKRGTARNSRRQVHREINRFYKDEDHEIENKPYKRCDNPWNYY